MVDTSIRIYIPLVSSILRHMDFLYARTKPKQADDLHLITKESKSIVVSPSKTYLPYLTLDYFYPQPLSISCASGHASLFD